jgi:hypothetical protein
MFVDLTTKGGNVGILISGHNRLSDKGIDNRAHYLSTPKAR